MSDDRLMPSIPERAQPLGDITLLSEYEAGDLRRVVVVEAAQRSAISLELLDDAGVALATGVDGTLIQDGDLVSFGTDGYGLGRVTYRIVSRDALWATVEREA